MGESGQTAPTTTDPARYFPVSARPYRMTVGLSAFGTDFGNGARDGQYFQRDRDAEHYRRAKAAVPLGRYRVLDGDDERRACHAAVLAWMAATLRREHPELLDASEPSYASIAQVVQEDFAVVRRGPHGRDEAIAVFVAFPSGWRPETIAGAGFKQIHGPVPGFAENDPAIASMLASMIERGPYVRFVWTITADDHLDHHPEEGRREAWRDGGDGWLRVERQVTVPFPAVGASLFLIRTYLYPFAMLGSEQRDTLAYALARMPAEIASYKGLNESARRIAERLRNS